MSLYYETIEKDGWGWEKIPITIQDIVSKIIKVLTNIIFV